MNIDTTKYHGGHILVEVLNEEGRPIPGYSKVDATASVGDHTHLPVMWSKPLDALIGRTVALRFHLTKAKLCAFQVRNSTFTDS